MATMDDHDRTAIPADHAVEATRTAAIDRLKDLFSEGRLSFEDFSALLDGVCAASSERGLAEAMVPTPHLVRRTPVSRRMAGPSVFRLAEPGLQLGPGWQLAAHTTVGTGVGTTRLDLAAATWDADHVDLHLETWGAIEVLVPVGTTVQFAGGSTNVEFGSLSSPVPGGPLVRIHTSGPTGSVRVSHPPARKARRTTRRRR